MFRLKGRPITDPADSPRLTLWPLPDQRHLYMLVAGVVLGVLLGPAVLQRFMPNEYDRLFIGSGDLSALEQARADYEQGVTSHRLEQTYDAQLANEVFQAKAQAINLRIEAINRQFSLVGDDSDSTAIAREEQIAPLREELEIEGQILIARLTNAQQVAQDELIAGLQAAEQEVLDRQEMHQAKLSGMATMMLLLVVVLFATEAILCPQRDELERGRAVLPPMLSRLVTVRYGLASGWLMLMLAQPIWLRRIDLVFGGLLLVVVIAAGLVPLGKRAGKAK